MRGCRQLLGRAWYHRLCERAVVTFPPAPSSPTVAEDVKKQMNEVNALASVAQVQDLAAKATAPAPAPAAPHFSPKPAPPTHKHVKAKGGHSHTSVRPSITPHAPHQATLTPITRSRLTRSCLRRRRAWSSCKRSPPAPAAAAAKRRASRPRSPASCPRCPRGRASWPGRATTERRRGVEASTGAGDLNSPARRDDLLLLSDPARAVARGGRGETKGRDKARSYAAKFK